MIFDTYLLPGLCIVVLTFISQLVQVKCFLRNKGHVTTIRKIILTTLKGGFGFWGPFITGNALVILTVMWIPGLNSWMYIAGIAFSSFISLRTRLQGDDLGVNNKNLNLTCHLIVLTSLIPSVVILGPVALWGIAYVEGVLIVSKLIKRKARDV